MQCDVSSSGRRGGPSLTSSRSHSRGRHRDRYTLTQGPDETAAAILQLADPVTHQSSASADSTTSGTSVDERQRQEFDFFINHCRRSHQSVVLAETMYSWLESKGYRVWLDVKMADKSTAAMEYVSVPT